MFKIQKFNFAVHFSFINFYHVTSVNTASLTSTLTWSLVSPYDPDNTSVALTVRL